MRFGSYFASVLLHAAILLVALLWPSRPPIDMTRTVYQVSLVDGAPGGEMLPSPVLGKQGDSSAKARAESLPTPNAPPPGEPQPAPAPSESRPAEPIATPEPPKPAQPVPRPESIPAKAPTPPPPAPDAREISEKKVEKKEPTPPPPPEPVQKKEPPKPDPQAEAKAKPEPAPEKKISPEDALKAALADAQKQAKPEPAGKSGQAQGRASSREAALSGALADMKRSSRRQGTGGGGGGEGDGPGGGGINDVYAGLVIMAVQPHWSTTTFASRNNFAVVVRIKLDAEGNVLDCFVERGSGNAGFDGSAVNAVKRARILPRPPTPEQQELLITFNSQDMGGR